jgi:hypothetical protein
VRAERSLKVVVVSSGEIRTEFSELLSAEARAAVVGWTQAEAHAGPSELLGVASPVLEDWHGEQEVELLGRWREEAGRDGRAASGWAETLEAASDGRVEILLYQQGVTRRVWRCPACTRLAVTAGKCPLDGVVLEPRDEGLDLAVHQTLVHGGTAWALARRPDLAPAEGVGALLRF